MPCTEEHHCETRTPPCRLRKRSPLHQTLITSL